jgi:Fe-S oxidoreductase
MNVLKSVLEGKLSLSRELAEFVYQCMECANCTEVCHETHNENIVLNTSRWIDHVRVWDALRKDLVEAGFAPLDRHKELISDMLDESKRNPYGEDREKKFSWAAEFPEIKDKGEVAFYGGCTIPLRQKETISNLMKILKSAGMEIAISKDEWCCSSIGLRIGEEQSLTDIINHNIKIYKEMGVKTLITACAGCFRTIKKDYPEFIGEELPFEVKHITEILVEFLDKNLIPFKAVEREKLRITYHDPCHLGRHMNLYEIPRDVLQKIPGVELVEMKRHRKNAWCCGAGGGVKSQFPDLALEISKERIIEAIETGADILTTSCPFCIGNLKSAYDEMGADLKKKIKVIDIIDFIAPYI